MEKSEQPKDIHELLHEIRSALQSMLIANEMAIEEESKGEDGRLLLKSMLRNIAKIRQKVDVIEKRVGGGSYDA